jgi:hypothetical protein
MKANVYFHAVALSLPEKELTLSNENNVGLSRDVVLIQMQSKMLCHTRNQIKVKQSHNRPGVAHRVPGGLGSQIFITFGT